MFETLPEWFTLFGQDWHTATAIVAFIVGLILG